MRKKNPLEQLIPKFTVAILVGYVRVWHQHAELTTHFCTPPRKKNVAKAAEEKSTIPTNIASVILGMDGLL